jgi:hypothetical protein
MLGSGVLAIAKDSRTIIFGCPQWSTTTNAHGHYRTKTYSRPHHLMQVRSDQAQTPRGRSISSRICSVPPTREAAPLSTKRTPPTPCCAERCSRACPTPSPSPPQKWRALSLSTRLTTKATTQIDFAAVADRTSANWLSPTRP